MLQNNICVFLVNCKMNLAITIYFLCASPGKFDYGRETEGLRSLGWGLTVGVGWFNSEEERRGHWSELTNTNTAVA